MYRWTICSGSKSLSLPKLNMNEFKIKKNFLVLTVVVLHLLFVKFFIFDKIPLVVVVFQDKLVKPFLVQKL